MTDFLPKQTDYHFQVIDLQLVDFQDDFLRSLHDNVIDSITLRNLQKFGQLYPLLVQQQTENLYHLVAGYPYFTAIKISGIKKIACQVLSHSILPDTLFSLQILHDLSSPQSSPIHQAHLLRKAQRALPENDLLSLLSLMGYKPQRYKLKELTDLLQLEPTAILALHRGSLSQKIGKHLSRLSHEDQRHLVKLIITYRLGGSKQQKLVEMVTELVLRDNQPAQEIINKWLSDVETTNPENRPQRIDGMMQCLQEQCSPGKTDAERHFKKLVQELQPPEGITIEHSLSFEDEQLEVRLGFADAAALRKKWAEIKKFAQ
jgi:ParB family chromosome partitioning protein